MIVVLFSLVPAVRTYIRTHADVYSYLAKASRLREEGLTRRELLPGIRMKFLHESLKLYQLQKETAESFFFQSC